MKGLSIALKNLYEFEDLCHYLSAIIYYSVQTDDGQWYPWAWIQVGVTREDTAFGARQRVCVHGGRNCSQKKRMSGAP